MNAEFRRISITDYVAEKESIEGKLAALEVIISKLELSLIDAADSSLYKEYKMKDGQMEVWARYNSVDEVINQIKSLEKLKIYYKSKLTGRVTILRSGNI